MLGGPGIQRSEGMLGFDWFIHQGDPQAGRSDLAFIGALLPGPAALRDRFDLVEALSGWNGDDVLLGDDRNAAGIVAPGDVAIGDGHGLTAAGIDRIAGLQQVLGQGVSSYDAGNIILGGNGSDTLSGRGGDDVLDGDKWVHVYLSVRTNPSNPATEVDTAETLEELEPAVFAGDLDPGNVVIVREIRNGNGAGHDEALFTDTRDSYQCTDLSGPTPEPLAVCPRDWNGGRLEVSHLGGGGIDDPVDPGGDPILVSDGTDIVDHVEELLFSDSTPPEAPTNVTAVGLDNSAQVDWLPSASAVTSYQVQVLDSTGAQVGDLRELLEPPDIAIGLLVEGLTNRQDYTFQVRGVNDFGPGPWSLPSDPVMPHADPPGAPRRPTVATGSQHVVVSWTEPANGGALITGYEVEVVDGNGLQVGDLRSTTDTTFDVTGLTNGQEYFFRVHAINEEGPGGWSPAVLGVPSARPGAPTLEGLDARNRSVNVRWTPPADNGGSPITLYRVQVLTGDGQQVVKTRRVDAPARHLLVEGLVNGRSYRFQVRAVNAAGASPWSASMRIKPSAK
jgi:hypothetical protein